ncbi:MAG: hypothetical protein AAGG48_28610 [Planctomycetota bacterium]
MAKKKITERDVMKAQKTWGRAIVEIGEEYMTGGDFVKCAKTHIKKLYGYGDGTVLFKPTKCEVIQFRPTREGALSYFVGDQFAPAGFSEDKGFAIAPYVAVHFAKLQVIEGDHRAIAMGNYFFTKLDGESVKVEYTFGYRWRDEQLVIDLHHSSFPFTNS